MAEPLKNHFGADVPVRIAAMVAAVYPAFGIQAFLRDALAGYEALELMPRGRQIAGALRRHLPARYPNALKILIDSTAQDSGRATGSGMEGFLFMPHCFFVAEFGLDHFEPSMQAQYELTQRFTAEFSIRPFLMRHPQATLARLAQWAGDPSEHVRRLVSEGTRPRLPWAPRLHAFQVDPAPVLALLESLRDDPALYVRRSVANNLNDIGKDNPRLLQETARRWLVDATPQRKWIVRHALRWALRQGAPWAFELLGYGKTGAVAIDKATITPRQAPMGGSVMIGFELRNTHARTQKLAVDFQVHFVKSNGTTRAKVFKLKSLELAANETARLRKTVSLAEMTTRKHYPGEHRVEALVNGRVLPLGSFDLVAP